MVRRGVEAEAHLHTCACMLQFDSVQLDAHSEHSPIVPHALVAGVALHLKGLAAAVRGYEERSDGHLFLLNMRNHRGRQADACA